MVVNFRADLHCHTTASDGSDSPEVIVHKALTLSLQGLSITDHDTIAAYEVACPLAASLGLPLLSGLELSSVHEKESVHILAYGFSLSNALIHELVLSQKKRREERNKKILLKLKNLGHAIDEKDLGMESHALGRPHIALALLKKGVITSVREGFDKYLGEGKAAYDPGERLSVDEAIKKIQEAGGKAILAHPHLVSSKKTLKILLSMPFDGIECYYALMPKAREAPFVKMGQEKGWIMTGGSDYHGEIKPQIPLGASWVGEETFRILYDHYQRNETQS